MTLQSISIFQHPHDIPWQVPESESDLVQLASSLGLVGTKHRHYGTFPRLSTPSDPRHTPAGVAVRDCDGELSRDNGSSQLLLIGQGGFAQVLLATAEDGESVAVKRTSRGLPFSLRFLETAERWAAEILISSSADHPNVLSCLAWGLEMWADEASGRPLFGFRLVLPLMTEW